MARRASASSTRRLSGTASAGPTVRAATTPPRPGGSVPPPSTSATSPSSLPTDAWQTVSYEYVVTAGFVHPTEVPQAELLGQYPTRNDSSSTRYNIAFGYGRQEGVWAKVGSSTDYPFRVLAYPTCGGPLGPDDADEGLCAAGPRRDRKMCSCRTEVPRLFTIPISHFCEKARWALDRTGIPYREERHVQLVHRLYVRRAGGGTTAPVLVTANGVFTESRDIVAWADRRLEPADRLIPEEADARAEAKRLVTEFDDDLGPHGRRWIDWHVLPNRRVGTEYNCTGVPAWNDGRSRSCRPSRRSPSGACSTSRPKRSRPPRRPVWASFDRVADRLADGPALPRRRPLQRGGPDVRGAGGIRGAARGVRGAPSPARGAARAPGVGSQAVP